MVIPEFIIPALVCGNLNKWPSSCTTAPKRLATAPPIVCLRVHSPSATCKFEIFALITVNRMPEKHGRERCPFIK